MLKKLRKRSKRIFPGNDEKGNSQVLLPFSFSNIFSAKQITHQFLHASPRWGIRQEIFNSICAKQPKKKEASFLNVLNQIKNHE
jgi:hypothetical protein